MFKCSVTEISAKLLQTTDLKTLDFSLYISMKKIKVKIKFAVEPVIKAQTRSRGIALLFL